MKNLFDRTKAWLPCVLVLMLALPGCDRGEEEAEAEAIAAAEKAAAQKAAAEEKAAAEAAAEEEAAAAEPAINTNAEVVVLCYHRLEGPAGGALSIKPETFKEHLEKIAASDVEVISMEDFLAWRRGEKSIPDKSVLITIDDGYVSSYEVGWPMLKEHGFPFTMFVYLDYINVGGKSITWDQLAEMRDAGVHIGSHTVTHGDLKGMDEAGVAKEVEESKQTLEEKLGIKVTTIAYPYGKHNELVREVVEKTGYEAGFTTYGKRLGMNAPAYQLGRYDVTTQDARGVNSFDVAMSFQGERAAGDVTGQDAAVAMVTQPAHQAVINEQQPKISANIAPMGKLDAASVHMRISGVGKVPASYDEASQQISFTPEKKLDTGSYTVIISGKTPNGQRRETRWGFTVDPEAEPSSPEQDPLPPRKEE